MSANPGSTNVGYLPTSSDQSGSSHAHFVLTSLLIMSPGLPEPLQFFHFPFFPVELP